MTLTLYAHPFSSYCQKALIALHENETPFTFEADKFGMADCSAAPSLFYGDWVHPIGPDLPNLRDYRQRLNARPSYARCIEEARPSRHFFPLGAPDRD